MDLSIVLCEEVKAFGLKVKTTMDNAQKDCPLVWEKLAPMMFDYMVDGVSYGASVHINDSEFYYYAAIQQKDGTKLPADFEEIILPKGLYARVTSGNLEEMSNIYQYIYTTWITEQTDFEFDLARPCYESYHADYIKTTKYDLFLPVKRK